MARIDYFNDPNAPKANSVVPSVTVGVRDKQGRILLVHKIDNDRWALTGGGHDAGESISDTAVREVLEETGVEVEITGIVGLYTNPDDSWPTARSCACVAVHPVTSTAAANNVAVVRRDFGILSPPQNFRD